MAIGGYDGTESRAFRFAVIIGCGRLGSHLAGLLSADGIDVVVVDNEESSFSLLPDGFSGFKLAGTAAEYGVLRRARTGEADLFIAVSGNDSINIMCAQIAEMHFKVPLVVARISDPSLEEFCRSLGLRTISPVSISIDRLLETIRPSGRIVDREEVHDRSERESS